MLTGRIWRLTKLGGVDRRSVGITATFTDGGRVSGFSGCNTYSGTFTTAGSSIEISDRLAVTMMACKEAVMRAESAFLAALSSADSYAVKGGSLTLFDRSRRVVAEFAVESQSLAGTKWTVVSYNNGRQAVVSVIARTSLTAIFGKNGDLSGSAGCNAYRASFKAAPPRISVGPAASTRKYCASPAGVMARRSPRTWQPSRARRRTSSRARRSSSARPRARSPRRSAAPEPATLHPPQRGQEKRCLAPGCAAWRSRRALG